MRARPVPVTRHGLGIVGDHDVAGQLADALQDVPRHPELVAGVYAHAGSHLKLPLTRHDLGVDTADGQPGVLARPVVGVRDVPSEHPIGTDTAVVRTLGTGVATLGPPEGPTGGRVQERVLLLDTEPRLLAGYLGEGEDGVRGGAGVARDGSTAGFVGVAHDEEVAAPVVYLREGPGVQRGLRHGGERGLVQRAVLDVKRPIVNGHVLPVAVEYVVLVHRRRPEGVAIYLARDEDDFGVGSWSLVGAAAVIVPVREVVYRTYRSFKRAGLAAQIQIRSTS